MAQAEQIRPDVILLRRLPPRGSTKEVPGRGRMVRPLLLRPRKKDHDGASYTRFPPTTPFSVLEQLRTQDLPTHLADPEAWLVCWIRVQEVLDLGIGIVSDQKPYDRGHCLLDPEHSATKGQWQQLAECTIGRIIDYSAADHITKLSDLPGWED